MELYLNYAALFFTLLVSLGIIAASWDKRDKGFYYRSVILLIPALSTIRQILAASGTLYNYALYVYLIYFLLRLLGPLLNWYVHCYLDKKIRYFNILNIITYLLLAYVLFDFFYALSLNQPYRTSYVVNTFTSHTWLSFSYPVIQLAHVAQAIWLLTKNKNRKDTGIYFIKIILFTFVSVMIGLQVSYVFFSRTFVELTLAPCFIIFIYSVILLVSLKYSSIHNETINTEVESLKQVEELSKRENEVLKLLSEGKTDKQIAEILYLSSHTVNTYCKRIYSKLNLKNRTEASHFYNNHK